MSEIGLVEPRGANVRVYSGSEVRSLLIYAGKLGYDLAANVVRNRDSDERYEEVRLRLSRLEARMLIHTDLVLGELPSDVGPVEPLSLEVRELFYWLLGNSSRRVLSMGDDELFEELRRQLRDYR